MSDVVVTVPKTFSFAGKTGLAAWVAEGDLPGEEWSGEESHFYLGGPVPNIQPGERVYVVCEGKLRGYAPLVRIERYGNSYALVRHGGAVAVTLEWEGGAALPGDRIAALKAFHERGIYTWVSLEPVIDTETTLEIIKRTSPFVSLYKVGRINYHRLTRLQDWKGFTHQVVDLLAKLGNDHYIKHDLQPYLPEGYSNHQYRPQVNR